MSMIKEELLKKIIKKRYTFKKWPKKVYIPKETLFQLIL